MKLRTARRLVSVVLVAGLLAPPAPTASATDPEPAPARSIRVPGTHFDLPKYLPALQWLFGFERSESAARPYWRKNLFRRVLGDQIYLLTSWWPNELTKVRFVLPITLAVVVASRTGTDPQAWDRRTARWIHGRSTGWIHDVSAFLSKVGESRYALLLIGSTYAGSRWCGSERLERSASLSAEALLNTSIYVGLIKNATRRTRPVHGGTGEFFVSDPPPGQSNRSFPSGHATGVFAVAAVFAYEFRDKRWVPWAAYGAASLIALSRVSLGRHFPTDVVTGAVLGDSIGRMVSHRSTSHTAGQDPMWATPPD